MINMNEKYVVNCNYILKNDKKRTYLAYRYNPSVNSPKYYKSETNFFSYIHPEQAKIFALFNGERTLCEIIDIVADKLHITQEQAKAMMLPFVENEKRLGVTFKDHKFVFPVNFLVSPQEDIPIYTYEPGDFIYDELDFTNPRIYNFPIDITLMLNTICQVDCVYCYADCRNKMDCRISPEVLEKLIADCRKNDVRSFNLMGGEVLMYKNWRWLVTKMKEYDYDPYISTKIPIGKEVVEEIYALGIRLFQISLDSFDSIVLEKNLNIPDGVKYIRKMKSTLKYFEEMGIKINIHAVITKHNKDIAHLEKYFQELEEFKNIENVQLSVVGDSLYKEGFQNHKLNDEEIREIANYLKQVRDSGSYAFTIGFSSGESRDVFIEKREHKKESYKKRGLCGANILQVFILPTGDVTICEELMFNPNFILGNINTHDLEYIWKHNQIASLTKKQQYNGSICGKCKDFIVCRGPESRKGICWKQVLHAYGDDKWNYPDPKCPYAPLKMNSFFV